ncbi:MAG: sigma-70 family RNA polymerase sigma factor [Planctomycetota bacterium]|nr:sigma-70 family RNA polymerase sigma factor [Planctomycetota bacterium]
MKSLEDSENASMQPRDELSVLCIAAQRGGPKDRARVVEHKDGKETIKRTCWKLLRNEDAVAECRQTTNAEVLAALKAGTYTPIQPARYWIQGFARNICLNYIRHKKASATLILRDPSSTENSAEIKAINKEERLRVRQAFPHLPEQDRRVLTLRDVENLTIEKTAQLLHVSTATVKRRHGKAKRELMKQMAQSCVDEIEYGKQRVIELILYYMQRKDRKFSTYLNDHIEAIDAIPPIDNTAECVDLTTGDSASDTLLETPSDPFGLQSLESILNSLFTNRYVYYPVATHLTLTHKDEIISPLFAELEKNGDIKVMSTKVGEQANVDAEDVKERMRRFLGCVNPHTASHIRRWIMFQRTVDHYTMQLPQGVMDEAKKVWDENRAWRGQLRRALEISTEDTQYVYDTIIYRRLQYEQIVSEEGMNCRFYTLRSFPEQPVDEFTTNSLSTSLMSLLRLEVLPREEVCSLCHVLRKELGLHAPVSKNIGIKERR